MAGRDAKANRELVVQHADDASGGMFFVERDGERLAELTYRRADPRRAVVEHTYVSEALRGEGVARQLVDATVAWSRASGVKLVPECTYTRKVLEQDAALRDVLA